MNRSPRMLFYVMILVLGYTWAESSDYTEESTRVEDSVEYSDGFKQETVQTVSLDNSARIPSSLYLNSELCYPDPCQELQKTTIPDARPWLTVFVHGIKSVKPHISLDNFFRFMIDDIEDTVYAKTIELMRKDPFFYKNQAMYRVGLHRADPREVEEGKAANAMALLFDEISAMLGGQKNNYYYTYGWSGLLSPKTRYKDAEFFFIALEDELRKYHAQGIYPHVRVIGYSHGGNVCLNLERIRREKFPDSTMVIDQLLLIGTPIQGETDYLVNGPLFKRAYNFFSYADRIQQLDFFSFDRFFSGRMFTDHKYLQLTNKLTQVQIKVTRNSRCTAGNPRKQKLAGNLNNPSIISGKSHLIRDVSPGHSELWFFGWTPVHYRDMYPLHPFPTVAFTPFIIHELEKLDGVLPSPCPVVVDLRPEHELMLIRPQHCTELYAAVPLLSREKLNYLKNSIEPFAFDPDEYSSAQYNKHIQIAYEHARAYYATKHGNRNPMAHKIQIKKIRRAKCRTQQTRCRKLTMNVALHQELNCPFCYQTVQVLGLIYRNNIHNLIKSSIDSCCARELRSSCEILLMS
jgi:hypothetical protein